MGGKSGSATVGYRYYMGLHMGLCHGPIDEIQEIRVGDRVAWAGSQATSGTITIDKPGLFGGDKREGGLQGDLDVMMGDSDQPVNSYLAARLGAVVPAFRGVVSLVFRRFTGSVQGWLDPSFWTPGGGGLVAALNPYIKPWAITVKRLPQKTWQPTYAEPLPGDANPAHMIRDVLTSTTWGMGHPATLVNEASFVAAAQQLHAEGFGLSMQWTQQESAEDFLQRVVDHIGAVLRVRPDNGQWDLKLVRYDYNPAAIPQLDPSNAVLEDYERAAQGEMVNEVQVTYTDPETFKPTSVGAQNLAGIEDQGAVIAQPRQYPGIRDPDLAQRVAMRDLTVLSTPLSRIRLTTDRRAWTLLPGDVFRLTWPDLGIEAQVYRIGRISLGTQRRGQITIEATEDVFGLPAASYASQPAIGWTDPSNEPSPCPAQAIMELTYWDLARNLSAADLDYLDPGASFATAWGSRPTPDAFAYDLATNAGSGYATRAAGQFAPWLLLPQDVPVAIGDLVIDWNPANAGDLDLVEVGRYGVLGDELLAVKAIDHDANQVTLARGVLDTVPQPHTAGDRLWFVEGFAAADPTEYVYGDAVYAKVLPTTGRGTLDASAATEMTHSITARASKPYPPGRFQIAATSYPVALHPSQGATVSWYHRDRTLQTAYLVEQYEASIGPEPGVTYNVTIKGEDGTSVIASPTGIAGTSFSFILSEELATGGVVINDPDTYAGLPGAQPSVTAAHARLTVELEAQRGGETSHQKHQHTVARKGYGYAYGTRYGD